MKNTNIKCTTCGEDFSILTKEYNRQIKRGRSEFFCTRTCAAIKNNKDNPRLGNPENLKVKTKDQYSSFRWFVNRGNYRSKTKKKYGCDLTVEFLKQLWEDQKGICPFTGWEMILPENSTYPWDEKSPKNASIDRIDNSIGYMQGNVRFVSVMANLARQDFTDEQVIAFGKAIYNAAAAAK